MPEPEITPFSLLFLIAAAQGVFFAIALFNNRLTDKRAAGYLALLVLVFSTELLSEFLDHSGYGLQFLRLMVLIFPTDFLYGPLIWLYTSRMCSRLEMVKNHSIYLHFIPGLIFIAVVWRLLLMPLTADPNFFIEHSELLQADQIQSWISPRYSQGLAILHMTAYLFACLWCLRLHSRSIANEFSCREGIALVWLKRLLWALTSLLALFVVRVVVADWFGYVSIADAFLNSGIVIVIYAMAYFAARQPQIFSRRIPNRQQSRPSSASEGISQALADKAQSNNTPESTSAADSNIDKYRKSALDEEMSARILKRLIATMENERPYLQNNLTLPDLARLAATSPNYLSQVINEQLQMNFFDFVNSYRVETAKQLIISPAPHTHTILDIAMESAFNSKSAFYVAFK
jgi:AraC-like DNA-binding protein